LLTFFQNHIILLVNGKQAVFGLRLTWRLNENQKSYTNNIDILYMVRLDVNGDHDEKN